VTCPLIELPPWLKVNRLTNLIQHERDIILLNIHNNGSGEVTFSLYTRLEHTMSPVLSRFQSPNFTQVLFQLQPSSTLFVTQTTPTINELVIMSHGSRPTQPLARLGKKLPRRAKRKDCFRNPFGIRGQQWATQSQPSQRRLHCRHPSGAPHPPLPVPPFPLK